MIFSGHEKMSTEFWPLQKQKIHCWYLKLNVAKCSREPPANLLLPGHAISGTDTIVHTAGLEATCMRSGAVFPLHC